MQSYRMRRPVALGRIVFSLALVALLLASAAHVKAQGIWAPVKYRVKDLLWCLNLRLPTIDSPCADYMLGVADLVRLGEVRFKGKRVCWPKGEPMTRRRVFGIVMKREKLTKWDPRAPAVAFIVSALAEAFPCKK